MNRQNLENEDEVTDGSDSEKSDAEEDYNQDTSDEIEDNIDDNGLTLIQDNNKGNSLLSHEEIGPLIRKVRKIVKLFRRSPTKNDRSLQKHVKEQFGKEMNLVLDSRTRWNSLLAMLERFFLLKTCIQKALIDLNLNAGDMSFSENEFVLTSTVISVLLPIKLTVEALCRQDATLITADAALQFMFNQLTEQNTSLSNEFKEELIIRVQQRRTDLSSLLLYLHNSSEFEVNQSSDIFSRINKTTIIRKILYLLQRLYYTYDDNDSDNVAASSIQDEINEVMSSDSEPEILNSMTMKEKLDMAISKKINIKLKRTTSGVGVSTKQNSERLNKIVKQEIAYFEAENIKGKYLQLAYEYLMCIPPTSVESERAFSAAGLLCTKIRSRLNDTTLDKLTFLRAYFLSKK